MDIEYVAVLCARECMRQNVGLDRVAYLIEAYHAAMRVLPSAEQDKGLLPVLLHGLATILEPCNQPGYRKIPVVFARGTKGLDADAVPAAMDRLFQNLDDDTDPAQWIKAFLDIHPFVDGNGRLAFVLWNWLNKSFGNPTPLPDLYAERK